MTILIPAIWYRGNAVIERRWGWSPVEEEVLLYLRNKPGTSGSVAEELGIPHQVAAAAVGRLMRFGLIEVRKTPGPALAMTDAADAHLRAGRPLPERTARREMTISLLFDKVGGSVFRRRDVEIKPVNVRLEGAQIVPFPEDDDEETDGSMESRVRELVSRWLRPGETLAMIPANQSNMEKRFIGIDLDRARNGLLPEGASADLKEKVRDYIATERLPAARRTSSSRPSCLDASVVMTIKPDQIVFGGDDHLVRLTEIVAAARSEVFVLSTFIAAQDDPRAHLAQNHVWDALEGAVRRGVRVHLFYGSSLDEGDQHKRALGELGARLRRAGGSIVPHLAAVHSHAKLLIADDGGGGARALLGSCNWLQSPFRAHELSVELRDRRAVSACVELLEAITAAVPTARLSREAMQAMRAALRTHRTDLLDPPGTAGRMEVTMRILAADDHLPLLRHVAHEARERMVVMTHRMGQPMMQNVLDPAKAASERIADVRAYYSLPSGPVKKADVRDVIETSGVDVRKTGSRQPMLHGKGLLWDSDDIVVTSYNWGSQTASEEKPLDEIGVHLSAAGIADVLISRLQARGIK
jgi:phosphatidylserine/phosphatidylglycerophosphate/cardiolipin synthase-like enzyme